jgi:hypothetical protein
VTVHTSTPIVSSRLAIVHNTVLVESDCERCSESCTVAVGPVIVDRISNAVVCRDCAFDEWPEIAAQFEAAETWGPRYMTDVRYQMGPLSLRQALYLHPWADWKSPQGKGLSHTEDILYRQRYGNLPEQMCDMEQPVVYIGSALYPAVPLRQEDVAPLLTLVRDARQDWKLDDSLIESKDLWLARDGVCWPPNLLRERLTLAQRATREGTAAPWKFRHVNGECKVIVDLWSEALFLVVRDLDQARDAFITLKLSSIKHARVVAARASDDSEEASEMKTRLIDAAVAALRQIRRNDQAAIEAIVGPVSVRMATPDDVPFWPVQAPENVF